jgi:hypothetical protein
MVLLLRRTGWTLVATVFVLCACHRAGAWGPHGHRIAARITESRLTPEAKAAVRELLHEGDTLVTIADWADHEGHDAVPGSAPWHYVNVPLDAQHYDARYCSTGGCVVSKIKHYRALVTDRHSPKSERARALLFLVHFVQDVHQPLHVGDNNDRGGNLTQIQYFNEGTNLHRMWDSHLIDDASRDERAWVDRIRPLLTPQNVETWSKGTVETWADESLQDAKKAYFFPIGSTRPLESGTRLAREYSEFALPIIRQRLAQAGVRLANELNGAFSDEEAKSRVKAQPASGVRP